MSDSPQDPWAAHGDGAGPPPPPPVDIDGPVAVDATEVRTGGIGARIVAAGVGAVLLLGGVAFAATQLGGSSGAQSPDAAVDELFTAIGNEDVLGVLATLDPGERDTLSEPVQQLFEELERLEVVDGSFELTSVPGVDLEFHDLTYRTEPILDGLARVHLTGGTASYAIDGAELPIGDFVSDTLDRFGVDPTTYRDEGSEEAVTGSGAEDDLDFLVARETDDGWRVSIGYTAAEAARLESGAPVPATGMAPIGSASPEAAVEGFLQAATRLDVRGMVGRLSPEEFRALHHYWPVLVDESDLPTADDLGATVTLTDLELDATIDGGSARVFIRSIGADVTADDFAGGATVADGCVTLRGDALEAVQEELDIDDDEVCLDELEELIEEAMGGAGNLRLGGITGFGTAGGDVPELGIATAQVDGEWYVAPIRTWADAGLAMLGTVDRADLDAAVDAIEGFFGGGFFGEGFFDGGTVGGGFVPPGLGGVDDPEGFGEVGEMETFEGQGEPIANPRTSALVEELVGVLAGDAHAAGCVLAELDATATDDQMVELADAYEHDVEPSPPTQRLLFDALERCGA